MTKRTRSTLLLASLLLVSLTAAAQQEKAKNVILFIGDGMGLAQVEAAAVKFAGQKPGPRLSWEHFPVFGYLSTFSANSYVTDSAAGASALATGMKTNNGMISTGPKDQQPPLISEIAKQAGKKVGVVSSVGLNHATPACFYARQGLRSNYDEIADQAISSKVADVILGGGMYTTSGTVGRIKAAAEAAGTAVFTLDNIADLAPEKAANRKVLGWFDADNDKMLEYATSRTATSREPRLAELTTRALSLLTGDNGFFLMVEGGSIDWAGHRNWAVANSGEVLELNHAVESAVEFLKGKGELESTLIIVTADHETGGMTLPGPYKRKVKPGALPMSRWGGSDHTGIPVMCWSQGPGSKMLSGKKDNTTVFDTMKAALGN